MYTVLVADDHPLFRDAISQVITGQFSGSVVTESEDLFGALAALEEQPEFDLVLLDLHMPGMEGMHGLSALRQAAPTATVVMVSAENERSIVLEAMSLGAAGFISKSASKDRLAAALHTIFSGQVYLPPEILQQTPVHGQASSETDPVMASDELAAKQSALACLTRKQLQVLERMGRGESNKQIAFHLNIAETTVKSHVSAILGRLGAQNRVHAVLLARELDVAPLLKS